MRIHFSSFDLLKRKKFREIRVKSRFRARPKLPLISPFHHTVDAPHVNCWAMHPFYVAGAVYSLEDDSVRLEGSLLFTQNSAGPGGGALSIGDPGDLSIVGANFTQNTANVGGAVSVNAVKESDRRFKECRFENNTATVDGGGMHFFTSGGSDNVDSSRFHGNHAGDDVEERRRVLR